MTSVREPLSETYLVTDLPAQLSLSKARVEHRGAKHQTAAPVSENPTSKAKPSVHRPPNIRHNKKFFGEYLVSDDRYGSENFDLTIEIIGAPVRIKLRTST